MEEEFRYGLVSPVELCVAHLPDSLLIEFHMIKPR